MKRALVVLAACSAPPAKSPVVPQASATPADAAVASQDEVLAAIQKAMNDLAPVANGCWAAAATERFDLEGTVEASIEVPPAGVARVELVTRGLSDRITQCMTGVLERYPWAPPLHGQTFRLPFKFSAPDGQSVIDRRLVAWHGQDKLSIAVLLDDNNTGNAAASMFEVAIAAGGSTGARIADRAELWYFLGPADVTTKAGKERVAAGDMVYVPKDKTREVLAAGEGVHAVVVVVPGGREGTARAGALPNRGASTQPDLGAVVIAERTAHTFGPATIFLDKTRVSDAPLAASVLQLAGGAKVPEHVHAGETELLYVLAGSGTMTVAGTDVPIIASSVVQIPPNTKHAFVAAEPVRAVQIYTPAGPEQRFKK